MSVLAVALLGLLVWALWWWIFLPRVHLFVLPIVHYDVLAVPPIPFSSENVAELAAPPPEGLEVNSRNVLVGLETTEGIETLSGRVQGVVTRPRDTLIVYVSAHGVSDDGTAYLLCSDYLRKAESGRHRLGDLLRQVSDCPAALKLLILDAGWLAGDPRLGMAVNEFPRLLQSEVEKLDDDALWVLAANRPLEIAHASYPMKRSVFGYFVAKALQGAADRDGDRVVDLDELFDFVRGGVAGWVREETGGRQTQTPQLLRGGAGPSEPPAGLALLPVAKRPKRAETQAEAPEEEGGQDGARPEDESNKSDDSAKPSETPDKPTKPPHPAGSQNDSHIRVRQLLNQAWTLRDQMQQREDTGSWTPIDYAPHLWREFQELLLGYELRYRSGGAFDADELAADLEANVLPLKHLIDGSPLPPSTNPSAVVARLADARGRFLAGPVKTSFDQAAAEAGAIGEAVRLRNDLLFRAPYYVRWHARASLEARRTLPSYRPVSDLLTEHLPKLTELLETTEEMLASGASADSSLPARAKEIQVATRRLEEIRRSIEIDGLDREAGELLAELAREPNKKGSSQRIEDLLQTPLLSAELRKPLLDALEQLEPPPLESLAAAGSASEPPPPASWQWERLLERTRLDVQMLRPIVPSMAATLDENLTGAGRSSPPRDAQAEEELWRTYRGIGEQLGTFYEGLPARIAEGLASADASAVRVSERLLRAVDARDAARVSEAALSIAVRPLPQVTMPEEMLALSGPDRLELSLDGWVSLDVEVRVRGAAAADTSLTLQYDTGLVTIEGLGGTPSAGSDRPAPITLQRDQTRQLRYQVRPAVEVSTEVTTPLTLRIKTARRTAIHTIQLTIPAPDVVDLVVAGAGLTTDDRIDDPGWLWLRPFPNRLTSYRFELVNRSGRPKRVSVMLLAVPAPATGQPLARESLVDPLGNYRPGVTVLAGPLEVDLPADAEAVPIPFPKPKPPEPPAEGAEPKPAAESPDEVTRPAITHGLACVIRQAEQKQWTRWVRFSPLLPKDYLDCQVSYNLLERRITIRLRARDMDDDGTPDLDVLPPMGPDNPIPVVWETAGVLDPNTEMNDRADLAPPGHEASLFAVVESAPGKTVPVRLTIDGCPRALMYQVKCDRNWEKIGRERSVSHIRITSPKSGDAFRAPLDWLPVEFQVDAPEDAFQQPGDAVEVGIDANGDRLLRGEESKQFLADRQVEVLLEEVGPGGLVKVAAKVSDFTIRLSPGGLRNKPVDLIAHLLLAAAGPGGNRVAAEDSVGVILDGAAPEVRIQVPGQPTPQGAELPVSAETDDLSGVEKMEFGFDLDGSSDLEESEKPKVLQQAGGAEKWSTRLPTKELEPGRYRLMARATDRVGYTGKRIQEVTIAPPAGDAKPAPSKTSTIQGRVVLGDRPVPRVTVRLEGTGLSAVSDADGRFTLEDVPHGNYTLRAKGIALNRFREGSAKVVLPAATEPAVVQIELQ